MAPIRRRWADDPLLELDNANLTPHALGYTDETIRLCSYLCDKATLDIWLGEVPDSVINRVVLEGEILQEKSEKYRALEG